MIHSVFGRLLQVSIAVALIALLSNCGLKGDLYLPEPEKAADQGSPESTAADQPDTEATDTSATNKTTEDPDEKARAKKPADTLNQP